MSVAGREVPDTSGTQAPSASLARNAFYLVLGQVATTALAIIYNGALGRFLGASDFGLFFLISSFAAFAFVLVDWGQQLYGIREVARAPERGGDLLGTGLVLRVVGTLLVCVPLGLSAWALGYDLRARWLTVAFIAVSLPLLLAQLYSIVFRGRDRMELDAIVSVVNKSVAFALTVPILFLGMGLGAVIAAQGFAGAASLLVAMRLYARVSSGPVRVSATTARQMLAGGTALAALNLAIYVQPYIDAVLLSKLVPRDAVGWYGAAKNIMGTLVAPAIILGSAAFPQLSRTAADPAAFTREVRTALRPMLWLGALAGVGTYLFADTAIALIYGHRQFSPAADILKVFGPGLFLLFVGMLFGSVLTALGRERAFTGVKIGSVVVSTGLDLALIPYFQRHSGNGGIGAVLAFVLSELVMVVGGLLLLPRGSAGSAIFVEGSRAIAAATLTAAIFFVLPPIPPWLGIPLCITAFAALSWAVGLVRRADLDVLSTAIRKRLTRGSIVASPEAPPETGT